MGLPPLPLCLGIGLALAGCATPRGPEATAGVDATPSFAARLPPQIGLFARQNPAIAVPGTREEYAAEAVRYLASGGYATVFIYRPRLALGPDGRPTGDMAMLSPSIIPMERDRAVRDMTVVAAAAGQGTIQRQPNFTAARRDASQLAMQCGDVLMPLAANRMRRDFACVGMAGGLVVKVRMTFHLNPDQMALTRAVVGDFVLQALASTATPGDAAPAPQTPAEPPIAPPNLVPGSRLLRV